MLGTIDHFTLSSTAYSLLSSLTISSWISHSTESQSVGMGPRIIARLLCFAYILNRHPRSGNGSRSLSREVGFVFGTCALIEGCCTVTLSSGSFGPTPNLRNGAGDSDECQWPRKITSVDRLILSLRQTPTYCDEWSAFNPPCYHLITEKRFILARRLPNGLYVASRSEKCQRKNRVFGTTSRSEWGGPLFLGRQTWSGRKMQWDTNKYFIIM